MYDTRRHLVGRSSKFFFVDIGQTNLIFLPRIAVCFVFFSCLLGLCIMCHVYLHIIYVPVVIGVESSHGRAGVALVGANVFLPL